MIITRFDGHGPRDARRFTVVASRPGAYESL